MTPKGRAAINLSCFFICSFKLILPNNESDKSFLKTIHVFKFRLVDAQLIKRSGKKIKNLQTCYSMRASQTAQSQGCLLAFFSTPIFKNCLVP